MTKYTKPLAADETALLPESKIDYSDIPELDEAFWQNAELRRLPPRSASRCAGPRSAGLFPPQWQRLSNPNQRRAAGIRADAGGKERTALGVPADCDSSLADIYLAPGYYPEVAQHVAVVTPA